MLGQNPSTSFRQLHLCARIQLWSPDNSEPFGAAKHQRKLCKRGRVDCRPASCAGAEVDRKGPDRNRYQRNPAAVFPRETFSLLASRLALPGELAAVVSAL